MSFYGTDYPDPLAEDGAALLDEVRVTLLRFVAFTSPEHADAVTLFVAATHAQPVWEHATRLVIKSPLKQCGKTRLQEIISGLAHQVLRTVNISSAALVRSIDAHDPPTLLLDEADSVFATRKGERSEKAEDLRGIINSGHSRDWPYIRWDVATRSREACPTFAMAVIGGIGDFPDTIEDRAIVLPMRRRAPGETVQQYRTKRVVPTLHELRDRLHAWVRGHLDDLGDADPDLPVEDRPADVWQPLVAIGDAAGSDWPDRARKACMVMTGAVEPDEATASERLLADLDAVFHDATANDLFDEPVPHLSTTVILRRLNALDESPWGDWYGKPFTARDLAKMLRPYGIKSNTVRTGDETAKGYRRGDLVDVWRRYVHEPSTAPSQGSQASQPGISAGQARDGNVTEGNSVSVTRSDQCERHDVTLVTDVSADHLNRAATDTCPYCSWPLDSEGHATNCEVPT
jgi:hypothetical protein